MNLKNKKVAIAGFGKTGFDVAKFLLNQGAKVYISDIQEDEEKHKKIKELSGKVEYEFGAHSPSFFEDKDLIVISPGVDEKKLLEIRGRIPVISEIELAYIFSPSRKIIAITGTNGKTTTTLMMGNVFKYARFPHIVCGNVGNTFIGEIEKVKEDTFVIIEVSSFQLEKIKKFHPFIGIILNIADDHFDRYSSFEEYVKAKEKIFINKKKNDWAVLNGDDEVCAEIGKKIKGNRIFFGFSDNFEVYFKNGCIYFKNEKIVDFEKTELSGKGNIYNTMAVICAGKICNIGNKDIERGIINFNPPAHRMEKVREINGVTFINDSKATNPHSVKNALESLPDGKIILLMGGLDKDLSFSSLKNLIEKKVKILILFGQARDKIEKELKSKKINIVKFEDLRQSVLFAFKNSKRGDIVLLSPGCASFDQFKNYKERGDVYKREVSNLL